MEQLPEEVLYNILEQTPTQDIPSLCSSNQVYRRICSDDAFWKNRFRQENLPILQQVSGYQGWYDLYRNTVLSYNLARDALPSTLPPKLRLSSIRDASIISLPRLISDVTLQSIITQDLYQSNSEKAKNTGQSKLYFRLYVLSSSRNIFYAIEKSTSEQDTEIIVSFDISRNEALDITARLIFYGLYSPVLFSPPPLLPTKRLRPVKLRLGSLPGGFAETNIY